LKNQVIIGEDIPTNFTKIIGWWFVHGFFAALFRMGSRSTHHTYTGIILWTLIFFALIINLHISF
jgi:hypothetical protein